MASLHDLIELLGQLGDRTIAEREARKIHAAIRALARGYDIGKDADGFYARLRRTKPAGPARELRDLAAAARKALRGKISREDWMDRWAAQPGSISRACRPFFLLPGTRSMDPEKLLGNFSTPGFTMVVAKPEAVLSAIGALREQTKKDTGTNSRERKPDLAAREVIAAVRSAYRALTGRPAGRTISSDGRAGRLVQLGRHVDNLYGTKIFPKADSRRLKKNFGDKKPCRPADT